MKAEKSVEPTKRTGRPLSLSELGCATKKGISRDRGKKMKQIEKMCPNSRFFSTTLASSSMRRLGFIQNTEINTNWEERDTAKETDLVEPPPPLMMDEIFFFDGNPKAQKPINSLSLSLSLSLFGVRASLLETKCTQKLKISLSHTNTHQFTTSRDVRVPNTNNLKSSFPTSSPSSSSTTKA